MGAVGTSPSRLIQSPIHPSFLPLLDDDFKEYYNLYFAYKPPAHTAGIEAIRSAPKQYSQHWCRDFTFEPFVNDIKILSHDGRKITARVYSPDARTSTFGSGPYPVYINFHGNPFSHRTATLSRTRFLTLITGGGYTLGDLTVDAELCMLIRNRVGITVIDVDYRLCPGLYYNLDRRKRYAELRVQKIPFWKATTTAGPQFNGYVPLYIHECNFLTCFRYTLTGMS